jgi:hypothetical protein
MARGKIGHISVSRSSLTSVAAGRYPGELLRRKPDEIITPSTSLRVQARK